MANPDLVALLVCDATAVDPGGKVTLYGVFDVICAERFPLRHPQFSVFCRCRFAAPGRAQLVVSAPDGSTLAALDPIEARTAGNTQAIYNFTSFEFAAPGDYPIVLVGTDGPVGGVVLEVRTRQ